MLGVVVVAAESDEEARFLFASLQQSSLNNRIGRRGRVPPPVANFDAQLDPYARAILDDALACAIVGGPDTVRRGLDDFIRRTGADELMVTANIFDHAKRKRSFEIVAEVILWAREVREEIERQRRGEPAPPAARGRLAHPPGEDATRYPGQSSAD